MSKNRDVNMLHGPLLFSIIIYTVPMILTNALQLLFNAADLVVVGRYCGSNSVAAVGSTSSLIHLIINLFIGLSIGCGITAAQALGAGDKERVHKIVHTALPTALVCGVAITIIGFFGTEFFLKIMSTPDDILPLAAIYLKIYFLGITATMIYNFCAAILRAAGDTKSPLIFLTISGIVNVVLNLIFVIFFHLDVAGVALATSLSQVLAAFLVVRALIKRTDCCKLYFSKLKFYKTPLLDFLRIGVPAGIQSTTFSFSNVIIQSSINSLGTVVVAGNSAAINIDNFLYTITSAFHQTALNFTGQNIGVKNYKRAISVYKISLLSAFCVNVVVSGLVVLFSEQLLGIYITDSADAIANGARRLLIIGLANFICVFMDVTAGAIRGTGVSIRPMIISILGVCGIRILWIFTIFRIPEWHTPTILYLSYPVSWLITFIALLVTYISVIKNLQNAELYKSKNT